MYQQSIAVLEHVALHCSFYASGLKGRAENETLLSHSTPRPIAGQTLSTGLTQLLPPLQPMPVPYTLAMHGYDLSSVLRYTE